MIYIQSTFTFAMVGTSLNALSQNNHNREDVILCGHCAYVRGYVPVMYSVCVCVCAWGTRETDRGTRSPQSCQRPPSPVQADPRATGHYWLETRADTRGGTHRTTERPKPLDQTPHPHLWTWKTDTHHDDPSHCPWTHYIPCRGDSRGPQQAMMS